MFYLVDFTKYYGGRMKTAFNGFDEIKKECVEKLNGRGWSDKSQVDLRNLKSCIDYLFTDAWNVQVKKSTSYNKFMNYRYFKK